MKNKRTTKKLKWRDMKPHTRRERKHMLRKYGSRCFLLPKELKYPVCNKYTGKIECVGLAASVPQVTRLPFLQREDIPGLGPC